MKFLVRTMKTLLIVLIRLYQWVLSPLLQYICGLGSGCRFEPSCSEYCVQALREYGFWKGGWLGVKRVSRCHPWGGFGYDPVTRPEIVDLSAEASAKEDCKFEKLGQAMKASDR